ncbi:unnamed protein product [Hymenolepis diminuta]|uniref:DUF4794 domain-containing protein n=1 Tax=Hymenolepis diminuta TaxID=6216 RepID=A0A0R3SQC9_HYMDI|nr:unnamed protein product [Hymenolepis diminuta]VUZ40828.1 unnamed protein product [Hymenolepis diminuta]
MKLGFVVFLSALTGLITEAQPIENLPRFPDSWFESPEPEPVQEVPVGEVTVHFSTAEPEELVTGSSASTETSTSAETAVPIEPKIETESATPLTTTISTMESTTTFAYTDEFHSDPFLTPSIKSDKSPIYKRIREPQSQEYNYDFFGEM